MKKRILAIALILAMLTISLAACGDKDTGESAGGGGGAVIKGKNIDTEPLKIAFINLASGSVSNSMAYVVFDEYFSVYPLAQWQIFDGQFDPTVQNNLIQECITQKYDAIICEVLDTEAVNSSIRAAEEAGIPFICFNPGATAVYSCHIQGADYELGWHGAKYLAEACGNKGNIILLSPPAAQVATSRMGVGARDYIDQNTDMVILDEQYIDFWSQEVAMNVMTDLLTKHDNIDAVYGCQDDIALGAVQAIKNAGREGILVWGSTGLPNGLQAIKDGDMYGTSFCNQYNELYGAITVAMYCVQTGVNAVSAGFEDLPHIRWNIQPVTKENVDFPIAIWDHCLSYYAEKVG